MTAQVHPKSDPRAVALVPASPVVPASDSPAQVMCDLVTWKYDEGTYVTHPTTSSYKSRGTVEVGTRHPDYPHMLAVEVRTVPTPDYLIGRFTS